MKCRLKGQDFFNTEETLSKMWLSKQIVATEIVPITYTYLTAIIVPKIPIGVHLCPVQFRSSLLPCFEKEATNRCLSSTINVNSCNSSVPKTLFYLSLQIGFVNVSYFGIDFRRSFMYYILPLLSRPKLTCLYS